LLFLDDAALDACRSIFERFGGKPQSEYFPQQRGERSAVASLGLNPARMGPGIRRPSDRIQDACAALVDAIGIVPVITGD
jgi:hypothetical protein